MMMDWPGCENARDLGGIPTIDGRRIRPGALIRSDSHSRLTAEAADAIRTRGVARILDLRHARECSADPSPFAGEPFYRHVPLLEDPLGYEPPEDTYAPMLDHHTARFAVAFREIAAAPPGAIVIHCRGGRDRTGALAALLLAVAGVADKDIAADFARTPGTFPEAMLNTLDHAATHYGGVPAYLARCGISEAEIAAVHRRLVTDPSG